MVKQPLEFTHGRPASLSVGVALLFPRVLGQRPHRLAEARVDTVQQTHGLLSGAQWTGVPLSTLLEEAGIDPGAKWAAARRRRRLGAHALGADREGARRYADRLRDERRGAARRRTAIRCALFLPGWEGNISVKWLRRIKVGDQPWHFRSETARYTDPMPDGKWRQFSMVMECKSVITRPSGGQKLKGPGFYEITGLAWSGAGKIRAVDVSVDGGKTWREAEARGAGHGQVPDALRVRRGTGTAGRRCSTSRAVDSTGYVQPTVQDIQKTRAIVGFVQHHNGIQPWAVNANGEVRNAIGQA